MLCLSFCWQYAAVTSALSRSSNVCGVHYERYGSTSQQATSKLLLIRSQLRQSSQSLSGLSASVCVFTINGLPPGARRTDTRATTGLERPLAISA